MVWSVSAALCQNNMVTLFIKSAHSVTLMTLTKVLKKAFTGGPNVDKESPELILDSCRVFRVEREDVADDDDGVQDDKQPHDDDVAKR